MGTRTYTDCRVVLTHSLLKVSCDGKAVEVDELARSPRAQPLLPSNQRFDRLPLRSQSARQLHEGRYRILPPQYALRVSKRRLVKMPGPGAMHVFWVSACNTIR
jgi:hypothetical protein